MSLQLIAKQMEAKGRKGDSMLVHMTPGEVAGLQKLAESAGGSLTVNPETGLVEANFLKRILSRALPTLAGIGVGMLAGPMAGAAAGAAVGGIQAKENDQSVGLGMLMGGLGGYGGAGIGAGLNAAGTQAAQAGAMQTVAADQAAQQAAQQTIQDTAAQQALQNAGQAETANMLTMGSDQAAQAAFNAQQQELGAQAIENAAQAEAERFAAQGLTDRAGQGIAALTDQGSNVGREAFMSKVGMQELGMAATPMMAPGEKPEEEPVDDEMYYYNYEPGRTFAESTPRSGSSERTYFEGKYSPVKKIRAKDYPAAQGGLLSLAEGGETDAAPNYAVTGASKAALDYLMGEAASSDYQGQGVAKAPAGGKVSFASNSHMYGFDPATGQYIRNPNYEDPDVVAERRRAAEAAAAARAARQARESSMESERARIAQAEAGSGAVIGWNSSENYDGSRNPDVTVGGPISSPDIRGTSLGEPDGGTRGDGGSTEGGRGVDGTATGGMGPSDARAQGGLLGLAKGGMASGGFVVPADVVSALGNGSTDAGLRKLHAMLGKINPIKGKGDGLSDSIPTHIDGKQRAKVADGEAYIDPKTVKRLGGAKKLYAMMDKVRAQAHGKTTQQRPVNPAKVLA